MLNCCAIFWSSRQIRVNYPAFLSRGLKKWSNKSTLKIRIYCFTGWTNYYYLTDNIIDAAVLWRKNSYIPNTFMNISFQFRKHLSLGRGGVILTDDKNTALELKKMSYDGRHPDIPWREQNIKTFGYHYYMTPETAQLGLDKIDNAIKSIPKKWQYDDWPDISKFDVFKKI